MCHQILCNWRLQNFSKVSSIVLVERVASLLLDICSVCMCVTIGHTTQFSSFSAEYRKAYMTAALFAKHFLHVLLLHM